ncbi:hypothetical protein [Sinomicrobium sp. M5D2P17]
MYFSKTRIIAILSFLPFLHVQAQDVFNRAQPANRFTEDLRVINQTQEILRRVHPSENNKNKTTDIVGTAYMDENFALGTIYYRDTIIGKYPLRYNVYAEEFELLHDNDTYSVSKSSDVKIICNGRIFLYRFYLNKNIREFGYFEIIVPNDSCVLLKKHRKILTESRPAITSFDVDVSARFVNMEDFFILLNNKEILEIKPKNSAIIKLFRTKGINLKPYLRENNLNIKRISDLTRVIGHVETLFRKD